MIACGPASEAEMLLAFLRAEIHSERFSKDLKPFIAATGWSVAELVINGDIANESQNALRRNVLGGFRGYGRNQFLFTWFPDDVTWRRIQLEPQDHTCLLYAKEQTWVKLSDYTRRVTRVAEKIALGQVPVNPADHIKAIQQGLTTGATYPEIIAVQAESDSAFVLVEGHCRATAYVGLKWRKNIDMLLGTSPKMRSWVFY